MCGIILGRLENPLFQPGRSAMGGPNREEAKRFIEFLYEPDDIFEVRVKYDDQKGAASHYITPDKREQFLKIHLPIHHERKGHVWAGVGPREKVGSTNPSMNRVLWCDFNDTVRTEEELRVALEASGLPWPSMIVHSGNGYHAYWKLATPLSPIDARKYSKGVHGRLPTDNTHDPTRVMRIPGTFNFKDRDNPKPCTITWVDEEAVYPVTDFPKVEMDIGRTVLEREAKQISPDDLAQFLTIYVEGQRHHVGLAVAGYLRKDRLFNREEALEAVRQLHTRAGYEWPDEGLEKVVADTYNRPMSTVSGRSALYEFGVVPKEPHIFTFPEPKKPKIELIDFTEDIEAQEFWVDGLVGPGLTTLWAAAPKTGKSFCVMQLGYHLSKGIDLWGLEVPEPKKVLYFQGELSRGMVYARAVSMFGRGNIPPATQYAMTDKPDETITINETPEVLLDIAEAYDVIIIDPLSAFNGNDENSYTSVRETLGIFDSLKAQGKALVLVHHTRKMGPGEIPSAADARGSGLWVSNADAIVMQQKLESGDSRLYFTLRAAPDMDPLTLYRLPHGGFTADRQEYLAHVPSRPLSVDMMKN